MFSSRGTKYLVRWDRHRGLVENVPEYRLEKAATQELVDEHKARSAEGVQGYAVDG